MRLQSVRHYQTSAFCMLYYLASHMKRNIKINNMKTAKNNAYP